MQKALPTADAEIARAAADERRSLKEDALRLAAHCAKYRIPSTRSAVMQIITTAVPFLALAAVMVALADVAPWATVALGLPLGGLVVRFFIIQHDCGHGSFLKSRRANDWIGRMMSVITITPYSLWQRVHAMHHAGSGNLDRRGAGDINTLTVREYLALPRFRRLQYRIYRNPVFLFGVGVPFFFVLLQRWPWGHPVPGREAWRSVCGLDVALIAVYGALTMLLGTKTLLLCAVPTMLVASAAGGWLFFVQHQFETTEWDGTGAWDFQVAAIHGSSHYQLPAVLHWFTGHIGLHHLHHLNSMVPNYRLAECLRASPVDVTGNSLSLRDSLACARLTLWDERTRRLIGFRDLRRLGRT